MKADVEVSAQTLLIRFEQEEGEEPVEGRRINMDRTVMEIRIPKPFDARQIHKDHLALITVLSVHPFVSKRLKIGWEVSQEFAKSLIDSCNYAVEFSSTNGTAYSTKSGRPNLAFSGGVDSTAALLLMSKETVCVWLDRPGLGKRTIYNKTAAKHTMQAAKHLGYEVYEIYCDAEHLRSPVGFPVDLSSGIAAIAMSSLTNGDSIAYGMIIESAYRTGHTKYRDYPHSAHYNTWERCFSSAGIPLFLPVGGVSEVGTSNIVLNSDFNGDARSCIRGDWPDNCDNCWKCFRKTLVDYRILGKSLTNDEMKKWIQVREVKYKISSWPISHENVLAWALKNPILDTPISTKLLKRLEGSQRDLELLSKWYPPSIDLIPEHYRAEFLLNIRSLLENMTEEEIENTQSLDLQSWLSSNKAQKARDSFQELMDSLEN